MKDGVKYAIAKKYHGCASNYSYISTLAHEYADEKDVIGYLDLQNALHFDSKEEAEQVLETQPEWVKNKHKIISAIRGIWGYYIVQPKMNEESVPQIGAGVASREEK